jgi:hypothetical protein
MDELGAGGNFPIVLLELWFKNVKKLSTLLSQIMS